MVIGKIMRFEIVSKHEFSVVDASSLEKADRFLLDEDIDAIAARVGESHHEWREEQGLYINEGVMISGAGLLYRTPPLGPPTLKPEWLYDQASRWEEKVLGDASEESGEAPVPDASAPHDSSCDDPVEDVTVSVPPQSKEDFLTFGEELGTCTLCGVPKRLTIPQCDVVRALWDAYPSGLTKDALLAVTRGSGALRTLKRLLETDPDWKNVVFLPGKPHSGGYRLVAPK